MVARGARTFPWCAGVSTPAGEISSVTASTNAPSTPTTSSGALRRMASEAQASACTPSTAQARVPG
ncbi:hypothetical protein ACWDBP_13025 [Streptomyces sp. NPDC001233]|uniref:hypothetical protein n=1 Tax=unclassified Streptomyces TaxID=2593676 RepID=UPI00332237E6